MKAIKRPKPFAASILLAIMLLGYNVPILVFQACTWQDVFGLLALFVVVTLVVYVLSLSVILLRTVSITLLLLNSAFLYFILFYKIKIYPPIMMAILNTESSEALELVSVSLVAWVVVFGLLPVYLSVILTKGIGHNKRHRLIVIAAMAGLVLALSVPQKIRTYALDSVWRFKQAHPYWRPSYVASKYLPYNYIYHFKLHLVKAFKDATEEKIDLTDKYSFKLKPHKRADNYFVLVIGESARADRFSLNGYKRDTNPKLSHIPNLVSFLDCSALDTSTLTAIPHIFRRELGEAQPGTRESSLLRILRHVGFNTLWLSCLRTQSATSELYAIATEAELTAYSSSLWHYNTGDTDVLLYDHALIRPLQEALQDNSNAVIVLHTRGSHFSYAERVPPELRLHTASASQASYDSMQRDYDDTIRYTDLFLSDIIRVLKDKKAVMLYISDHGESLGENGVHGHSAPLETAPKEQLHIPMIWWASDKFLSDPDNAAKFRNIRSHARQYVDQSYVFHSVLDCLDIQSDAVNKNKSVCSKWHNHVVLANARPQSYKKL